MFGPVQAECSLCFRALASAVQGYLAHKKQPAPMTLQQGYAQGPTVVLGGGQFLMSEVPLRFHKASMVSKQRTTVLFLITL